MTTEPHGAEADKETGKVIVGNVDGGIRGSVIAGRDVIVLSVEQPTPPTDAFYGKTCRIVRGRISVQATFGDVIAGAIFGMIIGGIIGTIEGVVDGIIVKTVIPEMIQWARSGAILGAILGMILSANSMVYRKRSTFAWIILRGTILGAHSLTYHGNIVNEQGTFLGIDYSGHRSRLGTIARGIILGVTVGGIVSGIIVERAFTEPNIGAAIVSGMILGVIVGAIVGTFSWMIIEKMGFRTRITFVSYS